MAPRQRPKVLRPTRRRTWAIRPVARPHSTPKGEKGYDRRRERRQIEDESPDETQHE